jgi:poly(hydroxyalkanoate) depolymerase family esterase
MNAMSNINMGEVTRLTQAGRLAEAIAVLRGGTAGGAARPSEGGKPQEKTTDRRARPIIDMVPPSSLGGVWTPPKSEAPRSFNGFNGKISTLPGAEMPESVRAFLDRVGKLGPASGLGGLPGSPQVRSEVPVPEGARFEDRSFSSEAGTRGYKLYVPSGYGGEPVPLIIMLHGCTQSPDDFAAGTRMNECGEKDRILVAYPGQTQAANASKCWNWFSTGDQQRDRGEPSLIAGITREIMRDFSVDPKRVYVAGLSAGGAAAAIMGSEYPDLYVAVGVHSGLACGAAQDVPSALTAMRQGGKPQTRGSGGRRSRQRPVPTIVFHGDSDRTVHSVNGDQVIAQSKAGTDLRSTTTRGEAPGGMAFTRTVQTDQAGNPVLEQWVLHGAGHAWSGGSPAGSYTDPRGPDASREMLRFFMQHVTETEELGAPGEESHGAAERLPFRTAIGRYPEALRSGCGTTC